MSFYPPLEILPVDPILGLAPLFKADPRADKVNLGVGTYLDEKGKPYLFPSVKEAEKELLTEEKDKEYLPIEGFKPFLEGASKLMLLAPSLALQTLGGTGALALFAELIGRFPKKPTVYLSDPSWTNHHQIFSMQGLEIKSYPYFDRSRHEVNFNAFLETVKEAPTGSVFILHTSCHNPTGLDLSDEEWQELALHFKKRQLFALFDTAYLGFAHSLEEDSAPVRLFEKEGISLAVTLSFAKCMGLYAERVGALLLNERSEALLSHLKRLARSTYSNPPSHGAKIAAKLFVNTAWRKELDAVRERLQKMRSLLADGLGEQYDFIRYDKGLFSILPLAPEEVIRLREKEGIYMLTSGRINLAGVNASNLDKVIRTLRKK